MRSLRRGTEKPAGSRPPDVRSLRCADANYWEAESPPTTRVAKSPDAYAANVGVAITNLDEPLGSRMRGRPLRRVREGVPRPDISGHSARSHVDDTFGETKKAPVSGGFDGAAVTGSNRRPPACKASAVVDFRARRRTFRPVLFRRGCRDSSVLLPATHLALTN
jgi:hypothetical protein